jgi:tungstate transport system substrate-binding protein
MARFARLLAVAPLLAFICLATSVIAQPVNPNELIILTTTTTEDSGILHVLADAFAKKSGLAVKTVVAGSGEILKQGARGEGDVLLTHSPEAEKAWMAEGNGTSRRLVMYNDFVIIGPANDPAKIKDLKPADAARRIAETKSPFVSRGDQSGTHVRELAMWKRAGIEPKGQSWYRETGLGQATTIDAAAQLQAYAFVDRGTYMVHARRMGLPIRVGLPILVENDSSLYNIYHVMPVNVARFPKVNSSAGQAFADWVVSPEAQAVIGEFGKERFGRPPFVPAAHMREEELSLRAPSHNIFASAIKQTELLLY